MAVCLSAFSKEISIIDIAGNKRFEVSIPEDESKTPKGAAHFIGRTFKVFDQCIRAMLVIYSAVHWL